MKALGKSIGAGIEFIADPAAFLTIGSLGGVGGVVGTSLTPAFTECYTQQAESRAMNMGAGIGFFAAEALIVTLWAAGAFRSNYKEMLALEQCPYRAKKGLKPY